MSNLAELASLLSEPSGTGGWTLTFGLVNRGLRA